MALAKATPVASADEDAQGLLDEDQELRTARRAG
jgi:hypothetical protein